MKIFSKADLDGFWDAYRKAGWNCQRAAFAAKEPVATWQNRIKRCKQAGYKTEGKRVVHNERVTDAELLKTFETYKQYGGNQLRAAEAVGVTRSCMQQRLSAVKRRLGLEYRSVVENKILLLDIETAPNRAFVWGTWKQNINPEWIDAAGYILCWTAKWLGEDVYHFQRLKDGKHKSLLGPIHRMLGEASAVVHYNGTSFDIPTLNKEFLIHGFTPPSPYKQIDLLLTMRERFRFPNNKLDYIAKQLSIGEKLRHEGPELWLKCMNDDPEAWAKMETYNKRDVELLEKLYKKLIPWVRRHPNLSALSEVSVCPSCGSDNFARDGVYMANVYKYEQYNCKSCGAWFRGTKTISQRKAERFSAAA